MEKEPTSFEQLAEDYLVSLKMINTLDPETDLYKWHEERRDYIKGIFKELVHDNQSDI